MKVVVIEDEKRAAKQILSLLKEVDAKVDVISVLQSVQEASDWFASNKLPDLIISDIQLGDGKAFEILEKLVDIPPVIFTTAYDEYAIRAFKSNGIDYLLKPIDPEELETSIKKYLKLKSSNSQLDIQELAKMLSQDVRVFKSRFMIKIGDKIKSVSSDKIASFYSLEGGSYLQTFENRNYSIDYSMDQLEEQMDPKVFFRINRKVLLNYSNINAIHTWSGSRLKIELNCILDPLEDDLLVSRERVRDFKEWLDR